MKVALYGLNRTGKTTLACEFPKPLALLTFEPGDNGGVSSVTRKVGVKVFQVTSSAQALGLADELSRDDYFRSVVIDSATSYQDLFLREIMGLPKLPEQLGWGTVSPDQYRMRSEKVKEGLRPFLALKKHVVVTAKEKDHNPPREDRIGPTGKVQPDMRPRFLRGMQQESYVAADLGGGAAGWLMDACDLVTRIYVTRETRLVETTQEVLGKTSTMTEEVETGKFVHRLRTLWHPNFAAGLRTPEKNCPEYLESEDPKSMYEQLVKLMRGEKL